MSTVWIIAGIICLIPLAWLAMMYLAYLVFWLLASNTIEYLIYPAIFASGVAGVWMFLHGAHVL
jgi:hypothetical protein